MEFKGLITWQIGDFWHFWKNEKNGKIWGIDFFWIFLSWSVVNHHSCILSELWGKNQNFHIFSKINPLLQKIVHFFKNWRKWVMNLIKNKALIETSNCLYQIYRYKTSLYTLLSNLKWSVINISLLNTLFQCRVKMTPQRSIAFGKYP